MRFEALVVVGVLPMASVFADITTFTSQERYILCTALSDGVGKGERFDAPDFGPFNSVAQADSPPDRDSFGRGHASQNSSLADGAVMGGAFADAGADSYRNGSLGWARGISSFHVVFSTSAERLWRLTADVTASRQGPFSGIGELYSRLSVSSSQGVLAGIEANRYVPERTMDQYFLLPPGTYTFDAKISSLCFTQDEAIYTSGSFSFAFVAVPSPGALACLGLGAAMVNRRRRGCESVTGSRN